MRIKQSVCYPMLKPKDITLEDFVPQIADIGYPAIELWARDEKLPDVVTLAKRHNMAVAIMSGHASLPVGLNDVTQHDRIEHELRESIDIAARFGIPGLICFSGNRQPGLSEEKAISATVQGLQRVAQYA
jgi:hydroxypyruvate isomerase